MEWNEIQRVMVVFAHPDDAEFGSAGTTAKLVRDGKQVVYVVVTDGSKGSSDPAVTRRSLTDLRRREQRDAAEILGLEDVCFLNYEDGMLQPTLDVRKSISAAIRRYRPDVVISQNPVRDLTLTVFAQHPDHVAAGEATLAAVYPSARDRLTFPDLLEQGLEPHAVREVWIVGTGAPNYFVDISDFMDIKIQALRAHLSQVGQRDVDQFVPDRAHQVGEENGVEYAEAYTRIVIP